jgi:phosphoglycolate phosphatase
MKKLIVFDLDGTLVDSIGGIAESVNRTREKYNFRRLPEAEIMTYVGDGARKLLIRSFADVEMPVSVDEALQTMIDFYAADPLYNTALYPGVRDGLQKLSDAGWILTVVSNKPQLVSEKILSGLGVMPLLAENIGGGGNFPLKPDPAAMLYLLEKYGAEPAESFVVGDNHTDLDSAVNAGMKSVFCRYGFGKKRTSRADREVVSFDELTEFLIHNGE